MNDSSSWYSISVTVAPEASEAVESAFNSLDSLGTEINHLRKQNTESVTVVGYFNDLPDEETVGDELQYALRAYGFSNDSVLQIERQTVENADWLAEWKKHWRPTEIAGFVIAPPWFEVSDDEKIVIRIEPNMAFGTGTHETTRLCLSAIDEHYLPGESFLDVGTGTGILAIAAAKMNFKSEISNLKVGSQTSDLGHNSQTLDADFKSEISNLKVGSQTSDLSHKSQTLDSDFKSEISNLKVGSQTSDLSRKSQTLAAGLKSQISNLKFLACDTDVDSIKIARENADLNGVGGNIEFFVGSIDDSTPVFDFVCANVTLDVIQPLLPLLLANAEKTLVLSGILAEQEGEIVNALRSAGVANFQIARDGEWISVVVSLKL